MSHTPVNPRRLSTTVSAVAAPLNPRRLSTTVSAVAAPHIVDNDSSVGFGPRDLSLMLDRKADDSRWSSFFLDAVGRGNVGDEFTDAASARIFAQNASDQFVKRSPTILILPILAGIGGFLAVARQMSNPLNDYDICAIAGFVMTGAVALFSLAAPAVYRARLGYGRGRAAVEAIFVVASTLFVLSSPSPIEGAFVTLSNIMTAFLVMRLSFPYAFAAALASIAAWEFTATAFSMPWRAIAAITALLSEALLLSAVVAVLFTTNDRRDFIRTISLSNTWLATKRILAAAVPRQILPALLDHIATQKEWSEAPVRTVTVTIVFVRFPLLSHNVYPANAIAAVMKLNELWKLCDATGTALGVTTLELTNTEYVGVVGLGGDIGGASELEASKAVRAGLAIVEGLRLHTSRAISECVVIGIHTGTVSAGFIGTLRPRYTLIGDSMNMASRMASAAPHGGITLSAATYALVGTLFDATPRTAEIKGKGSALVYDVNSERKSDSFFMDDYAPPPEPIDSSDAISKLFEPPPFNFDGFVDLETEARFQERPTSRRDHQFVTALILVFLLFIVANFGQIRVDWRFYIECFGVGMNTLFIVVGFFSPDSPWLVTVTSASIILSTMLGPLTSHSLPNIALANVLLIFTPITYYTAFQQTSICFCRTVLVTIFWAVGWYNSPLNGIPFDGAACIVFSWLAWIASAAIFIELERIERGRFASNESLVTAQIASAAVLTHLLPSSLFERLAKGDELNTLTHDNPDVAVLVADIVGFTAMSAASSSVAICDVLNRAFREFERFAHVEGAFKVKTVGDCIVFTAGLADFPGPVTGREARVELLARVAKGMHTAAARLSIRIRVGIHVSSVVSGVMNLRGFLYDIWGDGMIGASAAEAAAPLGGTAYTVEAAMVLSESIANVVEPIVIKGVRYYAMIDEAYVPSPLIIVAPSPASFSPAIDLPVPFNLDSADSIASPRSSFSQTSNAGTPNEVAQLLALSSPQTPFKMKDSLTLHVPTHPSRLSLTSERLLKMRDGYSPATSTTDSSRGAALTTGCGPQTWSWDVYKDNTEALLPIAAFDFLRPSLVCGLVPEAAAQLAVDKLCASYNAMPYHNAFHGVAVMQVFCQLVRTVPAMRAAFTEFDILILALAALGHDAGHTGYNNAFETASKSDIALLYGSEGPVLERYHAAATREILEESGTLVLVSERARKSALSTVMATIMASDLTRHEAVISDLRYCGTPSNLSLDALSGALVRCSDLSVHVFPRAISLAWTERISAEFTRQAVAEEALGLPVTVFMSGLVKPGLARMKMQEHFITRVVLPLWRVLASFATNGELEEPLSNLGGNATYYASEITRLSKTRGKGWSRLSTRVSINAAFAALGRAASDKSSAAAAAGSPRADGGTPRSAGTPRI